LTLTLTTEAKALFVQWHDEHCQQAEGSTAPFVAGVYSKLKGYCARLALIHALCLNPAARVVSVESVSAASDLIDYFVAHFTKIAPMLTRRKLTEEAKCERDILRHLAGGRIETKRELQQTLRQYPAKIFNPALTALQEADAIEAIEKHGGRIPRKGFRLIEGRI
jgi:hypothetical protein